MKKIFCVFALSLVSTTMFAGIPVVSCTNAAASIKIDALIFGRGTVTVVKSYSLPIAENIDYSTLNATATTINTMPTEKFNENYFKSISFEHITLTKKDGTPMPQAYDSVAAKDGSLSDYFICNKTWSIF